MRLTRPLMAVLAGSALAGLLLGTGCGRADDSVVVSGRVVDDTIAISAPALAVPAAAVPASAAAPRSQTSTVAALVGLGQAARVAEVNVGLGASVDAGQQVARLDDRALSAAIESARAARRGARAQLDVLGVRLEDVDDARSTIAETRSEVRAAVADLEKTQRELETKLADAKTQRTQLAITLKQLPPAGTRPPSGTPVPPGAAANRARLEAALAKLDAAIAKLEAALGKVDAGLANARSGLGQLDSASSQASDAEDTLTRVQKVARAALDGRDAAISLAEIQRDLAVLRSPTDGVVVWTVQSGEAVAAGAPVVVVRPSAQSAVDAWVTPEVAAGLAVGDTATVEIDSAPRAHSATVTAIGPRALFPPTWVTTTEVHLTRARPVRVTLTDPHAYLPPGTPADVEIALDDPR